MTLGKERVWLTGEKVKPWEMTRVRWRHDQMPGRLIYKYSLYDYKENVALWEREPSRMLEIRDPADYSAYKQEQLQQAGTDGLARGPLEWRNVNQVFLVNGHIEKTDANFVSGCTFDKIGEEHLFVGPYPQLEADADQMKAAGVTGVFNVQTEIDHAHRGIDWPKMVGLYEARGIVPVHFPIHDFNQDDLQSKLFDGACKLNKMIND